MNFVDSPKEILDVFIYFLNTIIDKNYQNLNKKQKAEIINNIRNYIIKILNVQINNSLPLDIDKAFNVRCAIFYELFKKKNKLITSEIINNEKFLGLSKAHLKKMEVKRTPDKINQEYGIAKNLLCFF